MMGIGRILHTHKSFSYCWCERIIHKPIANTKRVTFSEDGCISIELVRVLVWVVVWGNFGFISINLSYLQTAVSIVCQNRS